MKTYFKLIKGHTYDVMSRNPKPPARYQFRRIPDKDQANVVAVERMEDVIYFRAQPERLVECDPEGKTLTHKGGPVPVAPGGPVKPVAPGIPLTKETFKDPGTPPPPPPRPAPATVEVAERLTKEGLEGMERDAVLEIARKAGVSDKGNTKTIIGRILKAQDK